jgi:hypothetical protein
MLTYRHQNSMPKHFLKTIECGCIVKTSSVGVHRVNKTKMYLIGGHKHIKICEKCQTKNEESDMLHDMWMYDNKTDDFEHAGWKETLCNFNDNAPTPVMTLHKTHRTEEEIIARKAKMKKMFGEVLG